jgi:acetyl-CoA synthetase
MTSVDARVEELVSKFRAPSAELARLLCDDHDPDATAFVVVGVDLRTETLTYGDLRARSEKVAAGLAELGVGVGDSVATLMGKSAEYLATVLAIWRLGAAHVPLFTAFAPPAIDMRLAGSGTKVIVTDTEQRPKLDSVDTPCSVVLLRPDRITDVAGADIDFHALVSPTRPTPTPVAVGGGGAMVRMYTSGTTGRPKGVELPVFAMATWQLYVEYGLHVTEDDTYWCAADPGWAYGLFAGILGPLAAGRASVLHEDRFTAEGCWRVLHELGVTNFAAAPTAYRALRTSTPAPVALAKASSAGEPLTPEVNEWASGQWGIAVHDHYGQTELGMVFCNHHHPELQRPLKVGSMGVPLPGWSTGILREDSDEHADVGQLGRVVVDAKASPTMWFDGYVDAPEATKEKFAGAGRWYVTGDAGKTDEGGHYFFMARDDDVIIMAGYRIGPFDVESIIATHPDVAECAVIAVPDELKGEVIEAVVVLRGPVDDESALTAELQQRVRDNLAAYAYPRTITYAESLPKTPSGKIQRYVLRDARRAELGATGRA